ncbi:hypothetical protein AWB74_08619 [Caballeronia arvi]|uniref:ParB-like nuclease domain protein n=2 Tax=Caballeronia TaxID=1827195 RepID=A0A158EBU0_9BURK|nr:MULTISPECIES: ParB N-terminal domain-containing protein [Caballeronia]SAL04352.1 hypothetical protein AWB83_07014 [Caballeronia ptereochthonis]SAL88554.1 hypothetical protein AWB74_08619 [Caballeronia arvi]
MTDGFYATKQAVEASIAANPIPTPKKPTKLPPSQILFMTELFQHRLEKGWESDKHIATLKRVVKGGDTLEPLTVFWTGTGWTCIDGHHRADAYEAADFKGRIPVTVFDGSLDEAITHAAMTNSRDKLPMKPEEKTHAAWRLTVLTPDVSINDVHKATTVAKSRISDMRKVRDFIIDNHGKEYAADLRWREAWSLWKGAHKDDDVGSDDWVEREAQKLAERLRKTFGKELERNPEVTWRALDMYSPNLVERISKWLGVDWVNPEELEF